MIEDPIYLEEPFVRSQTWVLTPNQNVAPRLAVASGRRTGGQAGRAGCRTIRLARSTRKPAEKYGIPFEATQGGANTTYPEYQLQIQQLQAQGR